jgi:hypothetical protein
MTLRDRSVNMADPVDRLAVYLVLAAFVAYWWFMLRAMRSLLGAAGDLGRWAREWREEDRQ